MAFIAVKQNREYKIDEQDIELYRDQGCTIYKVERDKATKVKPKAKAEPVKTENKK